MGTSRDLVSITDICDILWNFLINNSYTFVFGDMTFHLNMFDMIITIAIITIFMRLYLRAIDII